ncbi:tetratricopeptide repeat protein [Marivirga lumbricoides]|uniref:tetratricopeptide repeat protein n=1 Tax=Marivirga lumbricoides TaxID=1046115 RepID=UPI00166B4408
MKYIYLFFIVGIKLLTAQDLLAQQPQPVQQEEILPDADPLKVDRIQVEFLIAEGMHFLAIENNAKALENFMKAYEVMPKNAAVNYKIAELYLKGEELDKALLHATKAYKSDNSQYYYAALLAEIQTGMGDLAGASSTYENMYKQYEDVPDDYLIELAALYIYDGKPAKALEVYDRIEKRIGILEEVSTQKQKILLKQNKLEEAVQEGKKLADAFPHVGQYAVSVAQVLVSNGKNAEAISYLNNYLNSNNQAEAHLELAQLYMQANTPDKAKSHFVKAFQSEEISLSNKLNNFVPLVRRLPNEQLNDFTKELSQHLQKVHPSEANVLAAIGDMHFALSEKDSALIYYRKAIEFSGSNFQLWQNILSLEMESANYKNVVKYADEALTFFPNQPLIYLYSGSAHFSLNQYNEAILMWEQGKAIVYGNDRLKSTFAGQLADAYYANKQLDKSFSAYEEAIEANPSNYYAINNYTYYLSQRKEKLDIARKLSSRMVKDNPENATFLDTHGWVLFQMGNYQEASKYLEKAASIQKSGTILEHYGDVLYQLGNIEQAIEQWEQAKKAGGASKLIDQKIAEKKYYE